VITHLGTEVAPESGGFGVILKVLLKHLASLNNSRVGSAHTQKAHILSAELIEETVVLKARLAQALM